MMISAPTMSRPNMMAGTYQGLGPFAIACWGVATGARLTTLSVFLASRAFDCEAGTLSLSFDEVLGPDLAAAAPPLGVTRRLVTVRRATTWRSATAASALALRAA